MASHARVINLTDGRRIKRSQALRRIDHCVSGWVDEGFTIRNLTAAESIAARNQQASMRDPLERCELSNVHFEPSLTGQAAYREGFRLSRLANIMVHLPQNVAAQYLATVVAEHAA